MRRLTRQRRYPLSDASRIDDSTSGVQRRGQIDAARPGDEVGAPATTRSTLRADDYVTGNPNSPLQLAPPLAGKPPLPDAPAARTAALRSGSEAMRAQADAGPGGPSNPRSHAGNGSDEIANDAITAVVYAAMASGGQSMHDDDARSRRNEDLDIAKSVRAGIQHIDADHAAHAQSDRLQRAGVTVGAQNPAERLAVMHRASDPGWAGGVNSAVRQTLRAASDAATHGLEAFPVGRRDLQG